MEGADIWAVVAPEDATSGAVEIGSGAVVPVSSESDGVGGGEDMIGTELPDTKLVETRVLSGLGRRL